MVSGGMSYVKYLLFAFNLVFVIFGILLLYAGFTTVAKIGDYHLLLIDAPNNVAIVLILVGFAIFLIAFLGCCGAIKESSCMLTSFSSIILVLLLVELIGAGLIFAFKSKLKTVAEDGIEKAIEKYGNDTDITVVLDDIQSHLGCCGARDYNDWHRLNPKFNSTDKYPHTCCPQPSEKEFCTSTDKLYTSGCVDKLDAEIKSSFGLLGGIAIAIAVIQLIGIVFACSLSRSIRKEYEVV